MRFTTRNLPAALALGIVAVACEDPGERRAREAAAARTRVAAESARASTAAPTVAAGRWDDVRLVKRLVDAGLAPQRRESVSAQPWLGVPVLAYQLGSATLDAYVFGDSLARRDAGARLEPGTLAPAGTPSPWGPRPILVQNGNLLAVIAGGTDRQQERIATALAAGVGVP